MPPETFEFVDVATGTYHGLAVRSNWIEGLGGLITHGWGNGYVGVVPGHPWYGKNIDELDGLIHVHGGVTFAQLANTCRAEMGFRTYDDRWYIGFDTAHYGDTAANCDQAYCLDQVSYLVGQAAMAPPPVPMAITAPATVQQFEET